MKSSLRDILMVLVCLAFSEASEGVPAASRRADFLIQSQVQGTVLVSDGKSSEIVPNQVLRGKVGLNEITVAAPAHGVRKLRFWLSAGERSTIRVDLARLQGAPEVSWKSLDKPVGARRLQRLPSLCVWYQEQTQDRRLCRRQTLAQDLAFAEPSLFPLADMRLLQERQVLDVYRNLVRNVLNTDLATTHRIEDFYREHAGIGAVLQLTSLHHLLRGDCPRVHSIYVDGLQTLPQTQNLILYKAICAEVQGRNELAQELYAQGISQSSTPAPYLLYHAGRLQLRKNTAVALQQADLCLKHHRTDLACQELALIAQPPNSQPKPARFQRINLEESTFKTFLSLESTLPQGQFDQNFFSVIAALNNHPHALEHYLFLAWLDTVQQPGTATDYYTHKMRVASILGGTTLEKVILSLEKQNLSQLLPAVYRQQLVFDPDDPNLWLRLVRAFAKAGQCQEALATMREGADVLPKYNSMLLEIQGNCYLEQKRLPQARDAFLRILEVRPTLWSSSYNVAKIFEQLGQTQEALLHYQKTLEHNPPPEIRQAVSAKITVLLQTTTKK